jgi:hypothetical protein
MREGADLPAQWLRGLTVRALNARRWEMQTARQTRRLMGAVVANDQRSRPGNEGRPLAHLVVRLNRMLPLLAVKARGNRGH